MRSSTPSNELSSATFSFDSGAYRAALDRVAGSTFGVLSVNIDLIAGPLADIAGGVDVSALGSGAVAALVYLGAIAIASGLADPPRPLRQPVRVPDLVPVPVGVAEA